MDKYQPLLVHVALIRKLAPKREKFNVFSVLRSESDEVRLHSRFIGALIDPDLHDSGIKILKALLGTLEIPVEGPSAFSMEGIKVYIEYSKIDIFITNSAKQSVIIENKIYAGDQYQQLKRYYDQIKGEGYDPIYIRYLTLDGSDPSEQSRVGLNLSLPYLQNASYEDHIRTWLDEAASIAVRHASVREGIFQYKTIIDKLTGNDQEVGYMNELIQFLLTGENMKIAMDIIPAYKKCLIELQDNLWKDIIESIKSGHPSMFACIDHSSSISDPGKRRRKIENYYNKSRNNRMFGLLFKIPNYLHQHSRVKILLDHRLYVSVSKPSHKENDRECKLVEDAIRDWGTKKGWKYCVDPFNPSFVTPNADLLDMLVNSEKRLAHAKLCAKEAYDVWILLKDAAASKISAE